MKTSILTGILAAMIVGSPDSKAAGVSIDPSSHLIIKAPGSSLPVFVRFNTHRFGRFGATASWSIDNLNGVTGFILQRTYEDPTDPYAVWDDINAIPCGSIRNFRVNDSNLSPGYISYRVVMLNGATPVGLSEVSTILIAQH
jgi:hypothetical protein